MESIHSGLVKLVLVLLLTEPLKALSVNPAICPTNKIAPHRRISRSRDVPHVGYQRRTLGAFYDLLAPGPGDFNHGYDPSLQEEPQRDDPDDCGDIDDYDEHDLSSLTPQYQRGDYGYGDNRFFLGLFRPQGPNRPNRPHQPQYPPNGPNQPQYPPNGPNRPQYPQNRPQQPQRPNRPPYASGGYFENNPYRPPTQHHPSDDIKPVHDGVHEPQTTYRPHVVGGPTNHVVGVSPVSVQSSRPRPTETSLNDRYPVRRPDYPTTRTPNYERYSTRRPEYQNTRAPDDELYPQPTTQFPYYSTRRSRPRQMNNNDSILGSFLDLLLK